MDVEKERRDYEAFVRTTPQYHGEYYLRRNFSNGRYTDSNVQSQWVVWLARAAQNPKGLSNLFIRYIKKADLFLDVATSEKRPHGWTPPVLERLRKDMNELEKRILKGLR